MMRVFALFTTLLVVLFLTTPALAAEEEPAAGTDSLRVLESFAQGQDEKSDIVRITDQEKRRIMFFMGVPLIVLLLITAGLGVAMVVYHKKVFVAHMIFAGLSLTLALAHAVVGTVWFYPF